MRTSRSAIVVVLLLAAVSAADEETVVVWGERPRETRAGVLRVRVVDGEGALVRGLEAGDFLLNRGAVGVRAVREIHPLPEAVFLFDDTIPAAGSRELHTALLAEFSEAWPGGRASVAFLGEERLHEARFVSAYGSGDPSPEVERSWTSGRTLERLLRLEGEDLFPEPGSGRGLVWKPLLETARWMADRLGSRRDPRYRGFLVLLTDGYRGHPLLSWDLACPAGTTGGDCGLFVTEEKVARETAWKQALGSAAAHPILLLHGMPTPVRMELQNEYRGALYRDRARLVWMTRQMEGSVLEARGVAPEELAQRVRRKIERRLGEYWIAWSTPEDERHGETFLKIELRSGAGEVVPDRIGEQELLGADPYLVAHFGSLDALPWEMRALLWPGEARRLHRVASRLHRLLGFPDWRADATCPFLLRREDLPPTVGPEVVAEALALSVPRPREQLGAAARAALEERNLFDLCALLRSLDE